MLSQGFISTVNGMAPEIARWPRRQPGRLMIDGRTLKYADLHSFYYQARQIFGERLYDFACASDTPVILDCGAHIGLASLAFKERYPNARIQAFEADAAIAGMCADNLAAFGFNDIGVSAVAVWTHANGVTFSASGDDAGHVTSVGNPVPSVRLADEIAKGPVDLLKLDVEGAEFALLSDCADHLAGVSRLIVEVHAFGDNPAGPLLSLLDGKGFRYVLADLHHATWMETVTPPPFAACRTDKFYFTVFAWR
jgi:FkbM family methyltransferase